MAYDIETELLELDEEQVSHIGEQLKKQIGIELDIDDEPALGDVGHEREDLDKEPDLVDLFGRL